MADGSRTRPWRTVGVATGLLALLTGGTLGLAAGVDAALRSAARDPSWVAATGPAAHGLRVWFHDAGATHSASTFAARIVDDASGAVLWRGQVDADTRHGRTPVRVEWEDGDVFTVHWRASEGEPLHQRVACGRR